MTAPTLHDQIAMRTRTKRAVREFKPKLWLDGGCGVYTTRLTNGDFETTGTGGFGTWTETVTPSSTVNVEASDVHGGTKCCRLDIVSSAMVVLDQYSTLTVGKTYKLSFWAKASATDTTFGLYAPDHTFTLTDAWAEYTHTFVATTTYLSLKRLNTGTYSVYLDDVSCVEVNSAAGNAKSIPLWSSRTGTAHDFAQSTIGYQPVYSAASNCATFAGTNDHLLKAAPSLSGASTGRIAITCSTSVTDAAQVLYCQSDTAGALNYCLVGISAANVMWYEFRNGAGAAVTLTGNEALSTGTHILEWSTDGSAISMWVDGSPQTITGTNTTGSWFGDVTGADNSTIGCKVDSTGIVSPLTGTIAEIVALEPDDTEANATRLRNTLARIGTVTLASGIGLILTGGAGILLADGIGLII
jgi:hypothetical protein